MITKDRWRQIATEMGCILPLTLWPIIIYFQMQPDYATHRHSATALFAVAGIVHNLATLFSVAGIVLVIAGKRPIDVRIWLIVAIIFHWWLQTSYLFNNAVAYA